MTVENDRADHAPLWLGRQHRAASLALLVVEIATWLPERGLACG
jgi:hypothetical protein